VSAHRALLVLVVAMVATSCTDADSATPRASGRLAGACPDPVVIQTDWNPEAEYGPLYALLGAERTVDDDRARVRGPLLDEGEPTGVDVEIRAGGPALGFQTVSAQLYQDSDVTLGLVNTDEAVRFADDLPTVAVMTLLDRSPLMLMWDPVRHPDVAGIADLGRRDVTVLYYGPDTYMAWVLDQGLLRPEQLDGGYDGSPARFVASGGGISQQGFATAEPYIYAEEVPEWGRPVAYELLDDLGYDPYPFALSVRADRLDELEPCLEQLVPVMQRAGVAFHADPEPTLDLVVELVERYDTGWVYSPGVARFSVCQQQALELVGRPGSTFGHLDLDRVDAFLGDVVPVLRADGAEVPSGLTADDVVTDRFLDDAIRLPDDAPGQPLDCLGSSGTSQSTKPS
jgi:hypothetical protein